MQDNFSIYDYFPLIRLSDLRYPMYMPQVRASTTQTSFPMPIKAFMLEPFGYMPVYDSEYPTGDVITEGDPQFNEEDGKWYKTWEVRDFTEEEIAANLINKKSELIGQANNTLGSDIWGGIKYNFKGVSYLVEVVPEKLTTLLCIKSLVKDAEEDDLFPFSFMDETVVTFTKAEFLLMWDSVMKSLYELNKKFWTLRDQIKAVTRIEDLPEIPFTFKPDDTQTT